MIKMLATALLLVAGWGAETEKAVLEISGAAQIEELSEEEMERFRMLAANPLDINAAGRSRLTSSGLLSPFQVAALLEYREESGDILSWTELSLVSGFSAGFVEALKCFVRLESDRAPGEREDRRIRHEAMVRGTVKAEAPGKEDGSTKGACGLKYSLEWGERGEFHWATRTTYDKPDFGIGTVSAAYYGRRWLGKVVAGDFAARFGQGLTAWSGFSLSSLTTIQAFRRNGTGLSPTSSFTSVEKGIGADFEFGRWTASAAWSFSSGTPFANITRTGRSLSAGLSATSKAVSADFKLSLPSLSIFGEGGWNGKPMGVAGIIWSPEYGHKYGAMAKYTNSVLQAAAGAESPCFQVNFEAKVNYARLTEQYRLQLAASHPFMLGSLTLTPALRLSGKLKPQETSPWRADIRADLDAALDKWLFHGRYNAVFGKAFAAAGYLEAGRKSEKTALWLRAGLFAVDNWDDRIYVYERDAPGSFNVPACYGRGWSASLVGSMHLGRHTVHVRLAATSYFTDKPGKLEAKVQYSLKL